MKIMCLLKKVNTILQICGKAAACLGVFHVTLCVLMEKRTTGVFHI